MALPIRNSARERGASWAPVLFLLGFLVALGLVALYFLEPMLRAASVGTPEDRKRLAAYASLAMGVMVTALLGGMIMALWISRRIARLARNRPKPTNYPDAWTESARRLHTPDVDELKDQDDDEQEDRPSP